MREADSNSINSTNPPSFSTNNSRPLSSWKEIAGYVGKGVRTVQRWEKEHGFPVHRPSPDRHVVLAIPAEIEAWIIRNREVVFSGQLSLEEELAEAEAEIRELRKQVAELRARLGDTQKVSQRACAEN